MFLVDARKGLLTQTRRHCYLAKLVGIKHIVLAVNRMDLVAYDQSIYDAILKDYAAYAASIGIETYTPIPISGFRGGNVSLGSQPMPWYSGPTLLEHLEQVGLKRDAVLAAATELFLSRGY